jgi:L-arabinose isomerase
MQSHNLAKRVTTAHSSGDRAYHLDPNGKLMHGASMLEVRQTIADGKASLRLHECGRKT